MLRKAELFSSQSCVPIRCPKPIIRSTVGSRFVIGKTSIAGMYMSDPLADSTAHLEQLLRQLTTEKDLDKEDQLVREVWKILSERDRIREAIAAGSKKPPSP